MNTRNVGLVIGQWRRKGLLCVLSFLFFCSATDAQQAMDVANIGKNYLNNFSTSSSVAFFPAKLRQRNYGMILGLQRGASTAIELGGEAHWRKISLRNPVITGASTNLEYSFSNHVIGYKAGVWRKQGRVNLTYGVNLAYFTDFEGLHRYGGGPAVGFRLAGFHFINGYNFLGGDKELKDVNTLYVTLRYYFPLQNKFIWDKKTPKQKAREKRKKEREKLQKKKSKQQEEQKGLRKLFNWDKEG